MAMSGSYWDGVRATGLAVPSDRPLDELTAELTRMLGEPDPSLREDVAIPTLVTWIQRGVYDDLLAGLGDGMAAGLRTGLGETGTASVLRRSASCVVLTACVERDNGRPLVPGGKVLEWGDRIATWLLRERDLRPSLAGGRWSRAIPEGAAALATLARSPHLSRPELTVILDVVADRVLARTDVRFGLEEPDRLAEATLAVLRRNVVPLSVLEPWIERITATAQRRRGGSPAGAGSGSTGGPRRIGELGTVRALGDAGDISDISDTIDTGAGTYVPASNAEAFLRSLHLRLALGKRQPEVRADLLLVVIDALRRCDPGLD